MQRPGSVGRCFFCFLIVCCKPEKAVGRTLCDLHISQELPFTFYPLISTMPIPSLRGECPRIFPRWLRQVPAAQLPACRHRLGYEMQRGGGHFIAQHKSLFFIATRTGIGRLALLPYALAVITGQISSAADACTRFLLRRPVAVGPAAPRLRTGNPAKLFHLSGAPATLKMKLSAL